VKVPVAECKRGSDNLLLLSYSTTVAVLLPCVSCFDAILPNWSREGGSEQDPNLAEVHRLGASDPILLGQRPVPHQLQWPLPPATSCRGMARGEHSCSVYSLGWIQAGIAPCSHSEESWEGFNLLDVMSFTE